MRHNFYVIVYYFVKICVTMFVKSEILLKALLSLVQAFYLITDHAHISCFILCVAHSAHRARFVVHGDEAAVDR